MASETLDDGKVFAVDSYQLHYVEQGEGPPLFLLPGLFGTYKNWNRVLPYLANSFTVISFDYMGVGDSPQPRSGFSYTIQEQAQVMAGMIQQLYPSGVNLAGVSYGGNLAFQLAFHYPELVKKAIIIEGFLIPVEMPSNPYQILLQYPLIRHLFVLFMKAGLFNKTVLEIMAGDWYPEMDAEDRKEVLEIVSHQCKNIHRHSWYQILRSYQKPGEGEPLPELTVPLLYLYGGLSSLQDVVKKNLDFFQEQLPGIQVREFPLGIHYLQLQKPREVAREIKDFIFQRKGMGEEIEDVLEFFPP